MNISQKTNCCILFQMPAMKCGDMCTLVQSFQFRQFTLRHDLELVLSLALLNVGLTLYLVTLPNMWLCAERYIKIMS